MERRIDEIRAAGAAYFPPQELDWFADEVLRLAPKPTSEFVQLAQAGNQLQLEYAAIVAFGITDITMTGAGIESVCIPFRAISSVHFKFQKPSPGSGSNLARLDVLVFTGHTGPRGTHTLQYVATQPQSFGKLREYCNALQSIVLSSGSR